MTEESINGADRAWVKRFRPMIDISFSAFAASGEWPKVADVQRALDRASIDIEVQEAMRELPRFDGEQTAYYSETVQLPLHCLRYVPEASQWVDLAFAVIRLAIDHYLSDEENPTVRSDEPELRHLESPEVSARKAAVLAYASFPHPFAGYTLGDVYFEAPINGVHARRMRDVKTVDEYVARQAATMREMASQSAAFYVGAPAEAPQPTAATRLRSIGDRARRHAFEVFLAVLAAGSSPWWIRPLGRLVHL